MANELTVTTSLSFAKGSVKSVGLADSGKQYDVTGTKYFAGVQNVGVSPEPLDLGDITTPGFIYIRNLDSTNYVDVRMGAAGADVVRVNAGESHLFRLSAATPYVTANTAAVDLEYFIVED